MVTDDNKNKPRLGAKCSLIVLVQGQMKRNQGFFKPGRHCSGHTKQQTHKHVQNKHMKVSVTCDICQVTSSDWLTVISPTFKKEDDLIACGLLEEKEGLAGLYEKKGERLAGLLKGKKDDKKEDDFPVYFRN